MYLGGGALTSNLLGLISTSKAEFGRGASSEVPDDEAADGGLIKSEGPAVSLPSLLDLESTFRRFSFRL